MIVEGSTADDKYQYLSWPRSALPTSQIHIVVFVSVTYFLFDKDGAVVVASTF